MRLFIAIDLNNREYFQGIQDKIKTLNLKASYPKSFHITLKFLGDTDKKDQIIKALKPVKFKPAKIKTDKIGFFPNENFIRVIWLGIENNEEINQLSEQIEKALPNFKKDYKFHPHVTLARVKYIEDKEKLKQIKPEQKEFKINEFILFSSNLSPKGAVYEEISKFL